MSTTDKTLTLTQLLFGRPAYIVGSLFIVAVIALSPIYNTMPALLSISIYLIMYINRRFIYNLRLSRYLLLVCLFYAPFLLSVFINLDMQNMSHASYMSRILDWRMLIFAPSIASILYLILVEFDLKDVRVSDLESFGLTELDICEYGSGWVYLLGSASFLLTGFLFGLFPFMLAILVVLLSGVSAIFFVPGAICVAIVIIGWNFLEFSYVQFLSAPRNMSLFIMDAFNSGGYVGAVKSYFMRPKDGNYGQYCIVSPYLLFASVSTFMFSYGLNKSFMNRFEQSQSKAELTEIDEIDFGREMSNRTKLVRLTHKELNTHMYINGASGSGKTVAMLNFVIEAAEKQIPLIYIDGKGATDLEEKISNIAAKYNRPFKVFTLSPDAVPHTCAYDFLGSGTFTEKKNRIMNLFIQADAAGVSYYQDNLEMFINRVFMVIHQNQLKIDLFRFLTLISNINDLVELAKQDIFLEDGSKVNWRSYFEDIRDMKPEQSPRTRIITKLDPFIHSSYGHLFNVIGKDNIINLKDSIRNGEIVLFLFDASAFALDTERVAKMVISDINATFAEFGKEKNPIKTFCCFDEFKSYETDAISKTISLHRSNGMHAIIGTQSLALINKDIGNGILSNCQTHLVMASADADAMRFSEEFGKISDVEVTTRIDEDGATGLSTKWVMDYKIDKQAIKDIRVHTGQGFLHRKAVGMAPVKIQVTQKI